MSAAMHWQKGQLPAWLMFSGMAIGAVGASVRKHAESVAEFVVFLGSGTDNSDLAAAVALGYWGLVLLVAGAVVVLAGLVVIALADRRRHAMGPRRRSVARRGLTSATSVPSELGQRVGGLRADCAPRRPGSLAADYGTCGKALPAAEPTCRRL
jgi:hypothetical protein